MKGERFKTPSIVRLLLGCTQKEDVVVCHCNTDRCNDKSIGGSGWPEYIGDDGSSESPGTMPDDGDSDGSPGSKPSDGDSNELPKPETMFEDGGSNGSPGTMLGNVGGNELPPPETIFGEGGSNNKLPKTMFSEDDDSDWPEYMPGDGDINELPESMSSESNGTKPGDGSKSSFGHVTSPFGHVIMAVALLVTIVIGYLL